MAKRPVNFRIDEHLLQQAADRANTLRESLTEVVTRALEAYVAEAAPAKTAQSAGDGRCNHPGTRIIGGWCTPCQHWVDAGGQWK